MSAASLGWIGIARLGLVQAGLGAVVVLTTSTLNRVMVVELALPAVLPGLLVALHYAVQLLRPRLGHGSDAGGRRTPWIVGGMAILAVGGTLAATAVALMATHLWAGVALAVFAFLAIGAGVGAAGTSLLVLLAKRVAPERRGPAATIVWLMMIGGFIVTATSAGHLLDPFSPLRLVLVTALVGMLAFLVAVFAVRGLEGEAAALPERRDVPFRTALAEAWADPQARRFTVFVFVSMLAYSAQDLILEPFAGVAFGFSPGESTRLAGLQHGGVLAGMLLVAVVTGVARGSALASLRGWTIAGCLASAIALFGIAQGGVSGPPWPLKVNVFLLGLSNGAFSIAAIASMMSLAGAGGRGREGVRMGLWGAAQAVAFGAGGFIGAMAADVARLFIGHAPSAYALVFAAEGALFVAAAVLGARIGRVAGDGSRAFAGGLGHAGAMAPEGGGR